MLDYIEPSSYTPYQVVGIPELTGIVQRFIDEGSPIGLDLETTGLDNWTNKLITIQLGDDRLCYIADLRHWEETPESRKALREIAELLFSGKIEVTGHNAKFDILALAVHLGMVPNDLRHLWVHDTMLAEQVILGGVDSEDGSRERASLEATAGRYGIAVTKDPRSYFIDLDKRKDWDLPFPEDQSAYVAQDIVVLPGITIRQALLIEEKNLSSIIALEMATLPAICAMELAGIRIDGDGYRPYLEKVEAQASALEEQIQSALFPPFLRKNRQEHLAQSYALTKWQAEQDALLVAEKAKYEALPKGTRACGWGECRKHAISSFRARSPRPKKPDALPERVNLNSPAQILEALSLIGVSLCSTEAELLEEEAKRYPEVEALSLLVEWRKLNKILGTYGETLLARIARDGRLHPSWRQIGSEASGVATGRMSCSMPNLQNLPAHTIAGDGIRNHIVASPGHVLISCDFNQQEMRVLAERSQDRALLGIFERGEDIYTAFAIAVGLAPVGTTKAECKLIPFGDSNLRDGMKTLTLAVSYGMGPRSLGHDLGVSEDKAGMYLTDFYAAYPQVKRYQDRVAQEALATGYSSTIGGRRRNFRLLPEPERHQFITWDGFMVARQQWRISMSTVRRQAVNHTIQGSAADITKTAMVLLHHRLPKGAYLVAVIHDEFLLEAEESQAEECARILEQSMEQATRSYLPTVALGTMKPLISTRWEEH